jgi:hypothetical protein
MEQKEVLEGLIAYLDEHYAPKRRWLEFVSDKVFQLAIEEGFKRLEDFDQILAKDFLEAGEAFLAANLEDLVDEVAQLGAQLFKILVFRKK